jgi:Zn-dependent alcohol dehydrogenase
LKNETNLEVIRLTIVEYEC